jgi:hypothetical protein
MQIRYINRALQRFDSTQVIPTQFVLFTLSVIIGSAVLYRDFENYTFERAGKFVGGCFLTFTGVYFITSGRIRSDDDESSYSADDEEEAIGLLAGDRYCDSVDMSPPARHVRAPKPPHKILSPHENDLQSPSGSLLSHGIEGIDEGQCTPRPVSSAAPSSPAGSLTADSLTQQSPEPSPPMHPNSLLTNPWADLRAPAIEIAKSETQTRRPVTPPDQSGPTISGSQVLLKFPPAPGIEDTNIQAHAPSGTENTQPGPKNIVPQTPPARRLRNSISSRFSPGPLLPTLSAGFSAVVAESLRRGETSPAKDRKSARRPRGKQLSTTVVDRFIRGRDAHLVDVEEGQNARGPLPTARFNSTGNIATAPVTAGQSITTLDTETALQTPQPDLSTSVSRLRSLSDSWSGGLAWLGGTLRKTNDQGNAPEQAPESQITEENEGANTQA